MQWLRNCWYQAAWTDELAESSSISRTIIDIPLLLFRDESGDVTILLDRCPHRFAPLSAGKVQGGKVTCGYHGLAFGRDGTCVDNPHGPITSSMRARSFPAIERHTAIWVWLGEGELCDPASIPDLSFIDETPPQARICGVMPTAADYRLLTDNIMDLSHADFLHPETLGGIMTSSKARTWEVGDQIFADWNSVNTDPIPAARATVPKGTKVDTWTQVSWIAPAIMVLGTATTPTGVPRKPENEAYTLHNIVPETARTSTYYFCSTRRFLTEDAGFSAYLRVALEQAFSGEDKPMVENQQLRMGDADLWDLNPILLPSDAGAVRVRRKLEQMIQLEQQISEGHASCFP